MKRGLWVTLGVVVPLLLAFYVLRDWLSGWAAGRWLGLGARRRRFSVQRGVTVAAPDGVSLAADLYLPRGAGPWPTVITRTPYGRSGYHSAFGRLQAWQARRFAERGYAVLVQDVRGRFDSDGAFAAYFNERQDGLATLQWMHDQPWCNGRVGFWGASYSGIVQWAVAPFTEQVTAYFPTITASRLHGILYPDGVMDLGLALRWLTIFKVLDERAGKPLWASLSFVSEIKRRTRRGKLHLPLREAVDVALNEHSAQYSQWVEHPRADDALWAQMFAEIQPGQVRAPVHLMSGWYDFFLRGTLADYADLHAASCRPYLTIGPWHHFQSLLRFADLSEGLAWFDTHLKEESGRLRKEPVRLYVMGAGEWRDYPQFPPSEHTPTRLYLQPGSRLSWQPPLSQSASSRYVYDPCAPTPAYGGTQFDFASAVVDNRPLIQRADVLSFASPPVAADLEVIGLVTLTLYVQSSAVSADFFARLCDLHPDGRSINVCDGLVRVSRAADEDGVQMVTVDLWATAQRFKAGHSLQLLVASGAHPRWNRNLGTGDQQGVTLVQARQQVWHDAAHPSALLLPVMPH